MTYFCARNSTSRCGLNLVTNSNTPSNGSNVCSNNSTLNDFIFGHRIRFGRLEVLEELVKQLLELVVAAMVMTAIPPVTTSRVRMALLIRGVSLSMTVLLHQAVVLLPMVVVALLMVVLLPMVVVALLVVVVLPLVVDGVIVGLTIQAVLALVVRVVVAVAVEAEEVVVAVFQFNLPTCLTSFSLRLRRRRSSARTPR
jgi:hypothetical protein